MRKFTPSNKDGLRGDSALSFALEWLNGKFFLSTASIRPSSVTILNVSTADANWTAIATGLSNVLSWKLTEKSGNAFHYCFDGVGTTYMTSYGSLQRETDISAIYVKRTAAVNADMQLEIWYA